MKKIGEKMVFVKLEGHDYKYQVEDIIKLFFNDEIIYIDEPNRSSEGIFIYNKISKVSDTTNTELEETKSKLKKCEAGFHDASQND
ncbi:MAG: hypothetical protein Q8942_15255, partial [Bacillota bacterium]|nr:hypothetical protein [Bacillota bacterium]